jgi:hypothetical protein
LADAEKKTIDYLIFYPDKFIKENKRLYVAKLENDDIKQMSSLLNNYNYKNKKRLIDLTSWKANEQDI